MSFTREEAAGLLEPSLGLQVDPGSVTQSMEAISPGAGRIDLSNVPEELQADAQKYGAEVTMAAYGRGWRPQSEHQGNPESYVGPVEYFDTFAERMEGKIAKQVNERMAGIEGVVEKRLKSLAGRVDRIDATDREATEAHYANLIASAGAGFNGMSPNEIPKLMQDRDAALALIDQAKADPASIPATGIDTAAESFFSKHSNIQSPKTPDDMALKGWVLGRAQELEAKYPTATAKQVFDQLDAELAARASSFTGRTLADGGNAPAVPSANMSKAITPATMTAEHRDAFERMVGLGAYKEGDVATYLVGLNEELGLA